MDPYDFLHADCLRKEEIGISISDGCGQISNVCIVLNQSNFSSLSSVISLQWYIKNSVAHLHEAVCGNSKTAFFVKSSKILTGL